MSALVVQHAWQEPHCLISMMGEARLENVDTFDAVVMEIGERPVCTGVILDLAAIEFMDSASTGSILRLHGMMAARDGKLVMHSLPRFVARLFDRLGLDQFVLAGSAEEAVTHL